MRIRLVFVRGFVERFSGGTRGNGWVASLEGGNLLQEVHTEWLMLPVIFLPLLLKFVLIVGRFFDGRLRDKLLGRSCFARAC